MLSRRLRTAAPGPLTCTFCATAVATGNAATITFNGVSIGNGGGRRREVVVLVSRTVDKDASSQVTSITVGGRAANIWNGNSPITGDNPVPHRSRLSAGRVNALGLGSTAGIAVTIADAFVGSVCRIFVFEILNGAYVGASNGQVSSTTANPKITLTPDTFTQSVVLAIGWVTSEVTTLGWFGSMGTVVGSYEDGTNVTSARDWYNSAAMETAPSTPTHTVEFGVTGDTNNGRGALTALVYKRA